MIFLNEDTSNSEIFIPPVAVNFRNNCQDAKWYFDGDDIGGDRAEFLFLAFCPYFGDLGNVHQDKYWGQAWGYPLFKNAPPLVFVTYLKTSGLKSFCNKWSQISSQRKDPARFLWRSRFIKETVATPQGPGKYYLLLWETEELKPESEKFQLAEKVETTMRANIERLVDNDDTARMVNLLGMDEPTKNSAIAQFKAAKLAPARNHQQLAPAS